MFKSRKGGLGQTSHVAGPFTRGPVEAEQVAILRFIFLPSEKDGSCCMSFNRISHCQTILRSRSRKVIYIRSQSMSRDWHALRCRLVFVALTNEGHIKCLVWRHSQMTSVLRAGGLLPWNKISVKETKCVRHLRVTPFCPISGETNARG